jgi:cobalt-zinc-cadmium resistance protein CzcA
VLRSLIQGALRQRWPVLVIVAAVVGLGIWAFERQTIEAYPDISAQMVQVITTFPGRAPEEVERQVTIPLELAMGNVPAMEVIRSRTIFGLSVVQMEFEEGTDGYWARQRVQEKLSGLTLPSGADPELGPLATAYGEIFRYELRTDGHTDAVELRALNDWVVIPRLLRAKGVADVSNFGGRAKVYAITLSPAQLQRYGLSLGDVVAAVQSNNGSAGGSVVTRGAMSFVVRGKGALETVPEIGSVFVKSVGGTPVYVRDIALVAIDSAVPSGIFAKDHRENGVEGIVLMRKGENPSLVLNEVQSAVAELNGSALPPGVRIEPFYDRSHLIDATLHTVAHSVLLGIALVVGVLFFFLGRPLMAGLVALTIPFALLFALVCMYAAGIPIGLLSVGAIDFGIIVDGAVIMADSIAHRLGTVAGDHDAKRNVFRTVLAAALEVERPVFFSVLMIVAAYVPLLTLRSIEGLLFRPMALTVVFAMAGALFFALFAIPVLSLYLFPRGYREWRNPLLRRAQPLYGRLIRTLLARRLAVVGGLAALLLAVFVFVVPRLGMEFLPYMDEGVVWLRANFPEGTALERTDLLGKRIREIVLGFEDIAFVSVQTGRNDSGTDPFPPSRMELMINPKPRGEWRRFSTKQELVTAIGGRLREEFPTTRFNFTQPIIDSVTEDTNGTSANVAVEFAGADPDTLKDLATRAVALLAKVPGAIDVSVEQEGPQPQLVISPDRALCARYDVRIDEVNRLINTALGGEPVGTIFEGERRFDLVVRFARSLLTSPEAVGRLPVFSSAGTPIPLAQLARIEVTDGQTIIAREGGKRRLTVRSDIAGRDQAGFVAEAQEVFSRELTLPPGYRLSWLGMFENLDRARRHFALVVPVTVLLIYALLFVTFKSHRAALLLLTSVPLAFMGGAVALFARGMNLNVSTGVGFAALFGVSIMNGVLLVKAITTLRAQGDALEDAIVRGAQNCLRPILMASLVAVLGLLPASIATGLGSDVQRPLATVIVWGLLSATVLTLVVVPVFYRLFAPPLPEAEVPGAELQARFVEPLPDVAAPEVVALLDYLAEAGGEAEIFRIAEEMKKPFDRLVGVVKAGELLGFIDTPQHVVALTATGRQFVAGNADERRELWREQLLHLRIFQDVHDLVAASPGRHIHRESALEAIMERMPHENHERMFNTFIRWSRYGGLFHYDEAEQRLGLDIAHA